LPASPLRLKRHWIVDDRRRHVRGVQDVPAGEQAADRAPGEQGADRAAEEQGAGRAAEVPTVLERISRISALSPDDLHRHLRLGADLGLDSLMLTDLEAALRLDLPGRPNIELTGRDLTIAELLTLTGAEPGVPRPATAGSGEQPAAVPEWGPETAAVESLPEVRALDERLRQLDELDLPNPYFRMHQGVARNMTTVANRELLSFSSYNYLGLSGHPGVNAAIHAAVETYGSSVSGSRLLSGERPLTVELERALAGLLRTEDCVTLVGGHATNVSAIGHLVGPGDLILHDELAHDSILQGCRLSGATRRPFAHNDAEQLELLLRRTRSRFRRVLIVVEGLYSMDGDLADLPALVDLKRRFGALLMVDEAHSIGTVGPRGGGVGEHFDVDPTDVDLWMGTLSKSFASCGGYLAGSARTIRWLRYTLPGFVYSVGLTPANAAAALAAIRIASAEPQRVAALRRNSALFLDLARAAGVDTGPSRESPIVPCLIGDSARTLRLATRLFERGVVVDPILHPAVAESQTRLRFFVTSEHSGDEIRYAADTLAVEMKQVVAQPVV
jgi:8-amino-7-oxononanoate synthase